MFHLQIILMALRGLRQNLLRSMLATLGVIIGVGAVVSAVSILEGAQRDILDKFESLGADQVIVLNGTHQRGHRRRQVSSLEPEDAERILQDNAELIVATSPQYGSAGQIKYYEKNEVVGMLGVVEDYATINDYLVERGRFVTHEDVRGNAMVCVLGYGVAEKLFGALPVLGKPVKLNGKTFIVVGVMEERGASTGPGCWRSA